MASQKSNTPENQWPVYHAYNRLAKRGIVDPLSCHMCYKEVTLIRDENDNPAFKCWNCDKVIKPGLNTYESVKWVVENVSEV